MLISEKSIFYYAIFGWFQEYKNNIDAKVFTYHKTSGYKVIFFVLLFAMLLETPIVHFVLSLWSPTVAWVVTGLTIYTLLYFLGDYNAMRLMPIVQDEDTLYFRLGLRYRADVALEDIEKIVRCSLLSEDEEKQYLKMTPALEFNTLVYFKKPQIFKGLFGITKSSDKIAIFVDENEEFLKI